MDEAAIAYLRAHRTTHLERLCDYLRIPSVSTDPQRRADMQRAAAWLAGAMRAAGVERADLVNTPGHPLVYGEWSAAGPGAPTVLLYGHYDVQPSAPDEEWLSPPFEPTVRDGYIYARGSSDDKGQHLVHVLAAEAFHQTAGAPPINLKFLIEGEEEIGSPNLEPFIARHGDLLACDAAVISDTGFFDAQTPALVVGTRGLVYAEIEVRGPASDLHSGGYGGVAHNPLQVLVEILAALHDSHGRVTIRGFYDRVRALTAEERAEMAALPFDERTFLEQEVRAPALWSGEEGFSVLERIGVRPTFEIHGIRGGFVGDGQKTVIPARALAKVSMRLVPDQDPDEVARGLEQRVRELAPSTVTATVRIMSSCKASLVERDSPAVRAAAAAYERGFGARPAFVRGGGTLPVVTQFRELLGVPVVMMGFGPADDRAHGPNERFWVDGFYKAIETSVAFMQELAKGA